MPEPQGGQTGGVTNTGTMTGGGNVVGGLAVARGARFGLRLIEGLIALGFRHFDRSMNGDEVSAFHAQAAIAATQARALTPEMLDWALILEFYDQLAAIDPSPVVALNRAVAVAKARGAADGLAAVAGLGRDPKLRHYHLLMAVRGQLLAELGRTAEAARSYEAALECEGVSEPERRFLRRRCEAVTTRGE